jgi:phosphohistidine phosphatase SixA
MASMGLDGILTEREGLEPGDSPDDLLADIIAEFGKTEHKVMLVGHDPFISDLASLMIGRSKAALPIKFTTGTLLGADGVAGGSSWALRFYITSKHLERLAPRQVSKNVA